MARELVTKRGKGRGKKEGKESKNHAPYGAVENMVYGLFVTFVIFGLLEEAHQRNMRWHLSQLLTFFHKLVLNNYGNIPYWIVEVRND
jgi:hypothetical protein